ncbi:MAG: MmgE/PrpD family protein [Betaproteobacteria bacterium]|nr:MmgE/PrpD family protein [Betaproteobacteria bacterium]
MTLTSMLVETCLSRLPARTGADALSVARRCLIDSLACGYAAADEQPIRMLRETLCTGRRGGESSVIGHPDRARAGDAALVNGTMISLQLFDDSHVQMRGHPSGPLLPAVLAVGEAEDRDLAEALTAFVVGCELECRLGLALNPSHYEIGWHATATQGIMGAAMACALLLGLDRVRAAHALGIAASMAGGLRRNFGTMTMSLHSGLAASGGVRAARLAAAGYTADPGVFDGAMSYGDVFSREWSPQTLAQDLVHWGAPFAIVTPGPGIKLFPLGRPALAAVDAVIALRDQHGISPADVESITCEVSYMYPRTLIHSHPATGLQGKTSLQYCVAATLVDGRPWFASFSDEATVRGLFDLMENRKAT